MLYRPGRQVEPQAQEVAQDVAEVAEEHVHRGNEQRDAEREQELHDGDHRDQQHDTR